ncbi:MAG: hypothetical protein KH170_03990, partial [Lachnospiraceae bacterium oral taxon 082]|nr:hypothetical protein [Lachnospiraceae bacterium oral taxon 082]
THYLKQREALNTALPIGVRQVETMRTLLTQSLAVLDKNAHISIAYNTIVIVINILYKLIDMC